MTQPEGRTLGHCPVCSREFPVEVLPQHANECLDSQASNPSPSPSPSLSPGNSAYPGNFVSLPHGAHAVQNNYFMMPTAYGIPPVGHDLLPQGWEMRLDQQGVPYYIDHQQRRSTYNDPRISLAHPRSAASSLASGAPSSVAKQQPQRAGSSGGSPSLNGVDSDGSAVVGDGKKKAKTLQELRQMDVNWLRHIKRHPEQEQQMVMGHIPMMLKIPNHKFGTHISKFVDVWKKKHVKKKGGQTPEQFSLACEDVKDFIDNTVAEFYDYYSGLQNAGENIGHYCHAAICDVLFPRIYDHLFPMFQQQYQREDAEYMKHLNGLLLISPAHLAIPKMFWLFPDGSSQDTNPPYHSAIAAIQRLPQLISPPAKINCLIEAADAITECITKYHKGGSQGQVVVGGDEFLPIFSYIVIKASIPSLFSESRFMEEFMSEMTSISHGGYLGVTLQTALSLINRLSGQDLERNAAQIIQEEDQKVKQKLDMRGSGSHEKKPVTAEKSLLDEDFVMTEPPQQPSTEVQQGGPDVPDLISFDD